MRSFIEISIDMFNLTDPIAIATETPTKQVRLMTHGLIIRKRPFPKPYLMSKFHKRSKNKQRDPEAIFDVEGFTTLVENP